MGWLGGSAEQRSGREGGTGGLVGKKKGKGFSFLCHKEICDGIQKELRGICYGFVHSKLQAKLKNTGTLLQSILYGMQQSIYKLLLV